MVLSESNEQPSQGGEYSSGEMAPSGQRRSALQRNSGTYGACERAEAPPRASWSQSVALDKGSARLAEFASYDERRDAASNKCHADQQAGGKRAREPAQPESSADAPTLLVRAAKVVPGLGIILSICASFSLGTAGMLVKMTRSVSGIQVAIFRSIIQVIIYALIIYLRKLSLVPQRAELIPVAVRAVLGASSMCFTYYALNLIPLGDATAIRFSLPIWTLIISYFFLSETCHLTKVSAVLIAVIGVVLIAKPDDCIYLAHMLLHSLGVETSSDFYVHTIEHEEARERELESVELFDDDNLSANLNQTLERSANLTSDSPTLLVMQGSPAVHHLSMSQDEIAVRQFSGCMLALASSVLLSISLIALRLAKKTPAEIIIFWLSVLSVLIGNCILIYINDWSLPDNLLDLFYILLNGLCGSAGQWFITNALKVEQSSIIALARTFDIEVAFLYSALLLQEQIRYTSIIGAVLVSLAVVIVVVPRWLGWDGSANPANNSNAVTIQIQTPNQMQGNNYGSLVINKSQSCEERSSEISGRH